MSLPGLPRIEFTIGQSYAERLETVIKYINYNLITAIENIEVGTGGGSTDVSGKLDITAAPELIRDTIASALIEGANVDITVNDNGDSITIASTATGGIAEIPETVVSSVIVVTGNEPRPADSDVVLWINLTGQSIVNLGANDIDFSGFASVIPEGGSTGQALLKASGTDFDVEWGTVASEGGSGGGASLIPPAGTAIMLIGGYENAMASMTNWVMISPVYIPEDFTLASISFDVVTGDEAANMRLGLYSISTVGGPGTLAHNFGVSGPATPGEKTITGPWNITKGLYYVASLSTGAGIEVRGGGGSNSVGLYQMLPLPGSFDVGGRWIGHNGSSNFPVTFTDFNQNGGQFALGTVAISGVIG